MKNPSFALSQAYAALLSGQITYNNKPVAIYDSKALDNATFPYVILGPWVGRKDNTKDSFGQTGQITLDVVTGLVGDQGSRKPAVEIANQITALIKPSVTSEVLNAPGFRIWNTIIQDTVDISDETNTKSLRRNLITISHGIVES